MNTGHEVEEVPAQVRLNWTGGLEFRPKQVRVLIAQQHYACFGFAKSILGVWRFLVGGGFALSLLDVLGRREFPCEDPSGSHDASRSKGFADFLVVQGLADCLGLDEATDFFGLGAVEEFPELVGHFGQHNFRVPHLFDHEGRGVKDFCWQCDGKSTSSSICMTSSHCMKRW